MKASDVAAIRGWAAGMTIAAQLFTLPLQVLIEPELPVFSILANLVVSPVSVFHVGWTGVIGLVLVCPIGSMLAWLSGCGTAIMEINAAFGIGQSPPSHERRHTRRDVGSGCSSQSALIGKI